MHALLAKIKASILKQCSVENCFKKKTNFKLVYCINEKSLLKINLFLKVYK